MAVKPQSVLARLLTRILAPGQGEVRALEQVLHLKGVLRLVILFAVMIVTPSLALAYFGMRSTRSAELEVARDLDRKASASADSFVRLISHDFVLLERGILRRLEAGTNTVEDTKRLHRHLLVGFRFDEDMVVRAPFPMEERDTTEDVGILFDEAYARAADAEREGFDPVVVAELYAEAGAKARGRAAQGRALFDQARLQSTSEDLDGAISAFNTVVVQYGNLRDPWGFRLGDLARLEQGRSLLAIEPDVGAEVLRGLTRDVLASRWYLGNGSEAAIGRRSISLIEQSADTEWVGLVRLRLAERANLHFWAGELVDEIQTIVEDRPSDIAPANQLVWTTGPRALWGTVRWRKDLYAFALDADSLIDELKADARAAVPAEGELVAYLDAPDEPQSEDVIVRRSLNPWLPGWAIAVSPRDPAAVISEQKHRRNQQIGIVLLAVIMLSVGGVLTVRLMGRELEVATMKADFAANVSHELRSPITQIRIKGEALLLGLAESEEERETHYRSIVRESERLSRLVDNVLDFAAIERGKKNYQLKPGNIAESVHRALEGIQASFELQDKDLYIAIPDDLPPVHHDPDALAQCVINLVSNAAKYSDGGASIRVLGRVKDGWTEVAVEDEGIGITKEDVEQIFDPFFRSRGSDARQRKGTGIGLTITHQIMQAHGGKVAVRSQPGKGSTFTLRFPPTPPKGP